MDAASLGQTEGVVAAEFEMSVKLQGAERLAYTCVTASGENAVSLHYMHNNALLRPGSLLLLDAGEECDVSPYRRREEREAGVRGRLWGEEEDHVGRCSGIAIGVGVGACAGRCRV